MPDERICDRFRLAASLQLDGVLPPLEAELYEAHALHCAACREYQRDVRAITGLVRRTPLRRFGRTVVVEARRPSLSPVRVLAAAVVATVVAGSLGADSSERLSAPAARPAAPQAVDLGNTLVRSPQGVGRGLAKPV